MKRRWLKQTGLDTPNLGHLKRIRKQDNVATLLLTASAAPPVLPDDLELPNPYTLPVPISPALTLISLSLKSSLWPTVYAPPRKGQAESWTRGKCRWAWEAMRFVVEAAAGSREVGFPNPLAVISTQNLAGQLPIAAHIPVPYDGRNEDVVPMAFTACDTRISNTHALRHAVINVIRQMADHQASIGPSSAEASAASLLSPATEELRGTNYLLTSLALFTTHEPCIMCSMALIHSRVKEVFYLYSMDKTGGCGGVACLPTLKGVNHRFEIYQWKAEGAFSECNLNIDAAIDA